MITVAVTGSVPTRDQHPGLPHTPAEIADATYDCYRAGAAIVHIHVRDPETGVATYRLELFRECVERIREKCDILINLTTSGNNIPRKNVIEERLEPVELGTELCSLDIGSLNLGYRPAVFQNPSDWSLTAAQRMRERGVKLRIPVNLSSDSGGTLPLPTRQASSRCWLEVVSLVLPRGVGQGIFG